MINENDNNNLKIIEAKEEIEKLKRSKETRAYFLFVFTQLVWTVQGLQLNHFFNIFINI